MKLVALPAGLLLLAFLALPSTVAETGPATPTFPAGAKSTGWIHFDFRDRKSIFIPAQVNGKPTMVLLANGLPVPMLDRSFATALGLHIEPASAGSGPANSSAPASVRDLHIEIGNLLLDEPKASVTDFGPLARSMGHPLPLLLGDNAFAGLVVELDFEHQRLAIRAPSADPECGGGGVSLPLLSAQGEHLVPASVEGAPDAEFELGLGNSGYTLLYASYYHPHHLLQGRTLSARLAGGSGGFFREPVGILHKVRFAGVTFADLPAAFIPATQTGTPSDQIAGDLGLPLLSRFRLLIDYAHDRVCAVPYLRQRPTPFPKDRLGLSLRPDGSRLNVRFVAPHSPAEQAGFRSGEKIASINGRPTSAWQQAQLVDLGYAAKGTRLTFIMADGRVRSVVLATYF